MGLALPRGGSLAFGFFFASQDLILTDPSLMDDERPLALSYLEIQYLSQCNFTELCASHPAERQRIRKFKMLLTFKRAVVRGSGCRQPHCRQFFCGARVRRELEGSRRCFVYRGQTKLQASLLPLVDGEHDWGARIVFAECWTANHLKCGIRNCESDDHAWETRVPAANIVVAETKKNVTQLRGTGEECGLSCRWVFEMMETHKVAQTWC